MTPDRVSLIPHNHHHGTTSSEDNSNPRVKQMRVNFANKTMSTENDVATLLHSPDKDYETIGELKLDLRKITTHNPSRNILNSDNLSVIDEDVCDTYRDDSYETKFTEERSFETLIKIIHDLPNNESINKKKIHSEIINVEKCTVLLLETVFHSSDIIMKKLTNSNNINLLSTAVKNQVSIPPEMVDSLKKNHEHDIYHAINILETFESLENSSLTITEKNKERMKTFQTKLKELKVNKSLLKDIKTGGLETPFDWVKNNAKTISKYSVCSILSYKVVEVTCSSYIKVLDKALDCFQNQDENESCIALISATIVLFSLIVIIPIIIYKIFPNYHSENNDH